MKKALSNLIFPSKLKNETPDLEKEKELSKKSTVEDIEEKNKTPTCPVSSMPKPSSH